MANDLLLLGAGRASGGISSLLTNLVSYWKLDEASGTRTDETGTNNLTAVNSPGNAAGKISNAVDFVPASSQYLSKSSPTTGTTKFTVAGWVYLNSVASRQEFIVRWGSGQAQFMFRTQAGGALIGIIADAITDPGNNYGIGASSLSTATWYHVAMVFDGTQTGDSNRLKIYLNAVAESITFTGAIPATLTSPSADLQAGAQTALGDYMDGRLDEWGMWADALTSTQIGNLYNSGSGVTYPFSGVP